MKYRHYIFSAVMAAGILAATSCDNGAIEPLTGKYAKPELYNLNTVLTSSVEKGSSNRTFSLELASDGIGGGEGTYTGTGSVLAIQFVGNNYYLHSAAFTPAASDAARNGNYIVGNDGATFYTVSGGSARAMAVESGSITVTANGSSYTFKGMLWLADESVVEISSSTNIVYESDPEPIALSNVLSASSNVGNGVPTVTLQLAQEGLSSYFDMNTYQTVWEGEGNYLAIDLYSADGYLHEGTYTANSVGGVVGEGQFGIGYDTTVDYGWGPMEMKDWGTCWWTVAGGVATAEKVLEGTITVTRSGSRWTIELQSGDLWTRFVGEIPALTDESGGGSVAYEELTKLISAQSNVVYGTNSLTFNIATDGVDAYYDAATYSMVYTGNGNYLALDIYSPDGSLHTGTYSACAVGGVIGEGEFGIGYDTEMWGMAMYNWGTCWWTVADGATSAEKVLDGTVTVSLEGSNVVVALESSAANARFVWPADGITDNSNGGTIAVVSE